MQFQLKNIKRKNIKIKKRRISNNLNTLSERCFVFVSL